MLERPLLSVIVPVYNVEKYIDDCIKSIINQHYSNLDILLIDDGSKDKCSQICDEYAKMDNRIRVIHQANQGLAKARNVGIKNAKGKYITFLDSDDFIDVEMYNLLMKIIRKYNVQIATCGMQVFNDGEKPDKVVYEDKVDIYSREEVIKRYLYSGQFLDVVSCNKIFDKQLFEDVVYPEGRLFEDFVPITKTILKANKIASLHSNLYFYRKRIGSINNMNFNIKKMNYKVMDLDIELNAMLKIIREYNPEWITYVIPGVVLSKLSIVNQMIYAREIDMNYVKRLQSLVSANKNTTQKCSYISKLDKIKIKIFQYFPIYLLLYRIYKIY